MNLAAFFEDSFWLADSHIMLNGDCLISSFFSISAKENYPIRCELLVLWVESRDIPFERSDICFDNSSND
jgi:hypothetical protein